MAPETNPPQDSRSLAGDRRGTERRRVDRRAPLPPWRRPWAFVAYGVAGAGLAALLWRTAIAPPAQPRDPPIVERGTAAPAPKTPPVGAPAPVESAAGAAGFERLTLEGAAALGRRVRTELYCDPPGTYQVREGVQPEAVIAALASNGRVPAAECKWGGAEDTRREDFVLLVPPELAGEFASAPTVTDQFQRRRRVRAEVEWLGRSEALALRPAGVFRGLVR